jgi:hypothetical protein
MENVCKLTTDKGEHFIFLVFTFHVSRKQNFSVYSMSSFNMFQSIKKRKHNIKNMSKKYLNKLPFYTDLQSVNLTKNTK